MDEPLDRHGKGWVSWLVIEIILLVNNCEIVN